MTLSLRTLSISLALSLALNLFLLGINAGPLFMHPHGLVFGPKDSGPHMMNDRPPGGRPSPERMIEDLAKDLPDSDRAKLILSVRNDNVMIYPYLLSCIYDCQVLART